MRQIFPTSLVLLLAGFVAGCSGPPTAASETPTLPVAVGPSPAAVTLPAFTVSGSTTCGTPRDNAWSLTMVTAGTSGASFHSVVAHSGTNGCVKTGEDRRVDDALLGVTGTTSYDPHASGSTQFVYNAGAFSCGSSQVTIELTAPDGRVIGRVLDTVIDYGVSCSVRAPLPAPGPPPPTTPTPPQPGPPPPTPPAPPPPPAPLGLVISITCVAAAHALPTSCNVAAAYNGAPLSSGAISQIDWDWGDGQAQIVPNSPLGSHAYGQAGTYRVEANTTATTVDGAKRSTAAATVIIS